MSTNKKKIAIFAAGTGGHVYPGLSIAKELMNKDISILWIGTKNGIEKKILEDTNIPIKCINFSGIRGNGLIAYIKLPIKLLVAIFQAIIILREYKANAVLSMGGYISFPCSIASFFLRIPIIIHEQNIIFGMTNNILRFLSTTVLLGFPMANKDKKYKFLGNPTRYEGKKTNKKEHQDNAFNILVVGGSLGAKVFNEVVPKAIFGLKKITDYEINVIHQTGKTYEVARIQYKNFNVNIDLREYINSMKEAYSWCDIVVCRGGAITITELMNFGLTSIIVPYPYAVDDHQRKNCDYLENNNASIVINQKNFTHEHLTTVFKTLIDNRNLAKSISDNISKLNKENSTNNICQEIITKIRDNEIYEK